MKQFPWILSSVLMTLGSSLPTMAKTSLPHIVLILCDDMGFSDLGCYGGEVQTPHIDELAHYGTRFSQFKNTGRSCPSRAALLTGRYQHEVDMGWMTAVDEHRPGYRGEINPKFPTLAEVLKTVGYHTYMSGKWHVTLDDHFDKPNGSYPSQRGFDQYYGCLNGGGSYYRPQPLYRNLKAIKQLPDDYYYTHAITDSAVQFIRNHDSGKPMFLYVAHYAPHLPLQAPEEAIQKCISRYACGYDTLRAQRFERQKKLGLIPEGMELPVYQREFSGKRPAWKDLTPQQQKEWVRSMATYAAMIEIMDQGIGQIVDAVREKGMLENTVFLFLSDNGSTNEGGFIGQLMADLSNTPYRSYKQWCFQGGTSTPFIYTTGQDLMRHKKGKLNRRPAHIIDIMPTLMELSGARYPEKECGSLPGYSLLRTMKQKKAPQRTLFFEHQSSCAIISGDWKLVRENKNKPWELIHLTEDPFETKDRSAEFPEKAQDMLNQWKHWAETHQVFPLENLPWTQRIQHYNNLYKNNK